RQSSLATVAYALMSEPSVSNFANVVVIELLSGSRSTLPHSPVAGSTKFGAFPAAIRNPSGFHEIASPLMKRAEVDVDATVVSSLMTTLAGGVLPSTVSNAMAGLSPLPLLTVASPPLATRYRMTSAPNVSWLPSSKRPSLFVRVWASCLGSPALAPQSVTVEFASGPPPAWTWPSTRTLDRCCADASMPAAVTAPKATSAANQIILVTLMVRSFTVGG